MALHFLQIGLRALHMFRAMPLSRRPAKERFATPLPATCYHAKKQITALAAAPPCPENTSVHTRLHGGDTVRHGASPGGSPAPHAAFAFPTARGYHFCTRMSSQDTITLTLQPSGDIPQRDMTLPTRLGPVRLIRELGRGGMGVVWLGHDDVLARDVAVKFVLNASAAPDDPNGMQFIAGARAAAHVRHPGLVSVHHADAVESLPYIVMDYVDGPSLRDVLAVTGALGAAAAVAVMLRVSAGVAALHEGNIVHRDIKPANVMVDIDGNMLVCDFGLACTQSAAAGGGTSGTPLFMAPEMFDGIVTPRTDVYALGIMAYALLTGMAPFTGGVPELKFAHKHTPLPMAPLQEARVPAEMLDWILRATHKSAMYRHKHAAALVRAIESASPALCNAKRMAAELAALLVSHHSRQTTAESSAPTPAPDASGGAYFDRLSQLANRKRG